LLDHLLHAVSLNIEVLQPAAPSSLVITRQRTKDFSFLLFIYYWRQIHRTSARGDTFSEHDGRSREDNTF
jgi:hypothetical protein